MTVIGAGKKSRTHDTFLSEFDGEHPGIDSFDSHEAVLLEIRSHRWLVLRELTKFTDNGAGCMHFAALELVGVCAVVSHKRITEH